jgi:hypothetical protein
MSPPRKDSRQRKKGSAGPGPPRGGHHARAFGAALEQASWGRLQIITSWGGKQGPAGRALPAAGRGGDDGTHESRGNKQ